MLIKDRFLVIDISALLYLVQDNEELKYRLLSLVEFTTEDIERACGHFFRPLRKS